MRHFKNYLKPALGSLRLDQIKVEHIQRLRASLVDRENPLSDKSINNVMAVLPAFLFTYMTILAWTALRYALEVELIEKLRKIRLRKIDRPEIEAWPLREYERVLTAAQAESPWWYAAVCLAGEAGLRVGEYARWVGGT